MVWGWIIAMIFIQCVAMAMAELCSAMPTRYDNPHGPLPRERMADAGFINPVAVYTTPQQSSHLLDMAHWLHGSPDGPTGSDRSQQRHQSTTRYLR